MTTRGPQARSAIVALIGLCALFAATGCSVEPPEVMALGARLVVHATGPDGGTDERLSVFASVSDGDGVDDIEYLFIVHDASELCWTLTADEWQRNDEGSAVWIGSNGLDAPGATVPRGEYRAVIVDRAGERSDRRFSLSAPETSAYDVPSVRLSGTSAVIGSAYPSNTAFFLDAGGNVVMTVPVSRGTVALDSLWANGLWRSGADYLAVYGFDPKAETGFFSWKIRLPD